MKFFTIGVYNSSKTDFIRKLTAHHIDTFCDIRQRRGVRGSQYTFANSNRLQALLEDLGIRYLHIANLAPTTEMREQQYEADTAAGVGKRNRTTISPSFAAAYRENILNRFNLEEYVKELKAGDANHIVLFCVEEQAEACHRSIVAGSLEALGYAVQHL